MKETHSNIISLEILHHSRKRECAFTKNKVLAFKFVYERMRYPYVVKPQGAPLVLLVEASRKLRDLQDAPVPIDRTNIYKPER